MFTFPQLVVLTVFRRNIQRFFAPQRRRIHPGLHAGIVIVEPAAGGQANGILLVKLVHWRLEFHHD